MRKKRLFLLFVLAMITSLRFPAALAARSGELTQRRTDTPSGYQLDYVDVQGVVTFATDKGYATVRRVVENKHTVEEYYFDEFGKPVKVSGYFGRINLYDGEHCVQITYVDDQGNPTLNSSGYAIIKRVVDDQGRIPLEFYFGTDGEPIIRPSGQGGLRRETFDDSNRVTQYTYLDTQGQPVMLKSGYSTVKRTYDEQGHTETDMYFGLSGEPVKRLGGYYGIRYIRDDAGNQIGTTYLDYDKQPMANSSGYITVMYEYDDWNHIVQYSYFDENGQPMKLHRGQYGTRIEYEGKNRIRSYYFDEQGREIFLLDQILLENLWLNVAAAVILTVCAAFLPRSHQWGLLLLYFLFILYMTMIVRESGEQKSRFDLFWSYGQFFTNDDLRVQILQNILLFMPFGALICSMFGWKAACIAAAAFSMVIEGTQYVFRLGLCEFDDIFSNALGGCCGAAAQRCLARVKQHIFSHRK